MIKQDYYATDKQGNCVNYGINCFSCSHWHGYFDNGNCDMFKITFTTSSSTTSGSNDKMTEKNFKIGEYLPLLQTHTDCVSRLLKAYKIVLKGCNEEELEEIFDSVRFDWKQFNNNGDVE